MSYSFLYTVFLSPLVDLLLDFFIIFAEMVNGIDSLISLSDFSLGMQVISVY